MLSCQTLACSDASKKLSQLQLPTNPISSFPNRQADDSGQYLSFGTICLLVLSWQYPSKCEPDGQWLKKYVVCYKALKIHDVPAPKDIMSSGA